MLPRVLRAEEYERLLREQAERLAREALERKAPRARPALPTNQLISQWGQQLFGEVLREHPRSEPGEGPTIPASRLLRGIIR